MPFNPMLQLGAQTAGADIGRGVYLTTSAPPCMWGGGAPPAVAADGGWQPFLRQRVPPPRLLPYLARNEVVAPPRPLFASQPRHVIVIARSCG